MLGSEGVAVSRTTGPFLAVRVASRRGREPTSHTRGAGAKRCIRALDRLGLTWTFRSLKEGEGFVCLSLCRVTTVSSTPDPWKMNEGVNE